jgi:hypothetical protein
MPTSALNTYNAAADKLQPYWDPEQAREIQGTAWQLLDPC